MDTHVSLGVPSTQSLMWSQALLAADIALDRLRACSTSQGYYTLTLQPAAFTCHHRAFPACMQGMASGAEPVVHLTQMASLQPHCVQEGSCGSDVTERLPRFGKKL